MIIAYKSHKGNALAENLSFVTGDGNNEMLYFFCQAYEGDGHKVIS
jgi:hypothetical protein